MALYSYRCPMCGHTDTVSHPIAEHDGFTAPSCPTCIGVIGSTPMPGAQVAMVRDYATDKPQPAPMWPEHFNPTTGTVVRSRKQLQSDMDRGADELYQRSGIESRPVVLDRADMLAMKPDGV